MLNRKLLAVASIILCGLVLIGAYNRPYRWWNAIWAPFDIDDMNEQPIIKPFEPDSLRLPPEGAVAVEDWEDYPDRLQFATYMYVQGVPENLTEYKNPIATSDESVKKGEELYGIYCYPCHGIEMSPTPEMESPAQKLVKERAAEGINYPFAPFNIHMFKMKSDEYIYGTITHGGAFMKRLDYHLSPEERWHVVNYVRSLANKYE